MTLSPTALANARESQAFWTPLVRLPDVHVWALLGNESGEVSFLAHGVGDHGEAYGICQWHQARIDAIKAATGMDVRTASHLDQLKSWFWEMNHGMGYSHVWGHLMATETVEAAVTVLVEQYEHSAEQARDIARRTVLAGQVKAQLGASTAA